jgi:flavin reductase (DIM6/NTAB) family NADH-FMN oxidoreductase RutF
MIRSIREIRVLKGLLPDLEKTMLHPVFDLTLPSLLVMMTHHWRNMTLDSEQLRRAMRAWTTGVTVVTAKHEDQQYGMTVNSFTSISLEPPLVSLALRQLTHTHDLVEKSGEFAVTILSADQKELSERFAGKLTEIKDRFEGVPTETLVLDAPLIKGGIAWFNCRVVNAIPVGENTLFVAEVIAVRGDGEGDPLVYHNRVYHRVRKLDSNVS